MVWKQVILIWIKAVSPNDTSSHVFFIITYLHLNSHTHTQPHMLDSCKNVLEAVKFINFIGSWPLSTCLFNILYDEMEKTPKAHLRLLQNDDCLKEKCFHDWIVSWTSCFFIGTNFSWKNNQQTNYCYLDFSVWQTFSQKKKNREWSKPTSSRKTPNSICCQ